MGYTSYSSESRAFYSNSARTKTRDEIFKQNVVQEIHQTMNPFDMGVRECRDSEAHPEAFPIIIALDVTGSMGKIPEWVVKEGLTHIMENILDNTDIDPAICFMAIGDQYSDTAPLQVGQFESGDNELALWLERTWLEGRGGGGGNESYPLAWYAAVNNVVTDHWEKRNRKGIIITVGDESSHPTILTEHLKSIFNVNAEVDVSVEDLFKMTSEKWNIYHLHINDASYPVDRSPWVFEWWVKMLGKNAQIVQNSSDLANTIVSIVKNIDTQTGAIEPFKDDDDSKPTPML